jgi:hypothetical protein
MSHAQLDLSRRRLEVCLVDDAGDVVASRIEHIPAGTRDCRVGYEQLARRCCLSTDAGAAQAANAPGGRLSDEAASGPPVAAVERGTRYMWRVACPPILTCSCPPQASGDQAASIHRG